MPKIAITGKGGVGKTTLTALLSHVYKERGQDVIAIDADPAGNLGLAFGLTATMDAALKPIADMDDLIYERTGAQKGTVGGWFKLNPKVDDIPENLSFTHRGVRLLRLGTVRTGGAGCLCPENALLKALVTHLLLRKDQTLFALPAYEITDEALKRLDKQLPSVKIGNPNTPPPKKPQ